MYSDVRCWSELQHTANSGQETKLTLSATFGALCSSYYEPICVLKYREKTETLGKDTLTQFNTKGGQIALSCQTLWVC